MLMHCSWFVTEELRARKFFVQHVETVTTSEANIDIVQSFVVSVAVYIYGHYHSKKLDFGYSAFSHLILLYDVLLVWAVF